LDKLLGRLRAGDTVYIYKLDRLGRALKHPLQVVGELQQRGVGLRRIYRKAAAWGYGRRGPA
jgi:DNA invertase Pin-like site-specific DNA recombinase